MKKHSPAHTTTGGIVADRFLCNDGELLLSAYSRDGMTMKEIAEKIGVNVSTLYSWMTDFPNIKKALQTGRDIVDYKVENALLKRALGYTTKESKITMELKDGCMTQTKVETIQKEVDPNVTAIVVWLNNRKPDTWKRNRDNVLETTDKDSNITVNIFHDGKKKDLSQSTEDDTPMDDTTASVTTQQSTTDITVVNNQESASDEIRKQHNKHLEEEYNKNNVNTKVQTDHTLTHTVELTWDEDEWEETTTPVTTQSDDWDDEDEWG